VATASAQPCPDVEVVFARGHSEPPGVGQTGQSFVDALRAQAGNRSVGAYPVNYDANANILDRIAFAGTVIDGIRDASTHIETMAANCPRTRMVLGGYSEGAAVAGYTTADVIPPGLPVELQQELPEPMPPAMADHVAAVVLLGMPSDEFMRGIGAPPIVIGPRYADKTLKLCTLADNVCDGSPAGLPSIVHQLYPVNGMTIQAAGFVVARL